MAMRFAGVVLEHARNRLARILGELPCIERGGIFGKRLVFGVEDEG